MHPKNPQDACELAVYNLHEAVPFLFFITLQEGESLFCSFSGDSPPTVTKALCQIDFKPWWASRPTEA